MKIGLSMVILFVKDMEKLKKFYTESFQLELVEEIAPEWVVMSAGNCQLALHQIPAAWQPAADSESNCESNTKMVFDLDEDIQGLRDRLVKDKLQMREIKTFDNYPFLLCDGEDPEGNVFQLRQRKR